MALKVLILLGTTKGAFILEGISARRPWEVRGPFCDGWPINHVIADPASGAIYAGGGNDWVGHDIWKSTDLGANWTRAAEGLAYDAAAPEPVKAVWSLAPAAGGTLYAGVKPAGLFRSDDGGRSWRHIEGLQKHPTRPEWRGGGAGLILHSMAFDPNDARKLWVGMSAVGVFHSADGGETWGKAAVWRTRDGGDHWHALRDGLPQANAYFAVLRQAMATDRLDPAGVYFRTNSGSVFASADEGESWTQIAQHLPTVLSVETHVVDA